MATARFNNVFKKLKSVTIFLDKMYLLEKLTVKLF